MTTSDNQNFLRAIEVLTQHGEMRVWSIIVTLFGDLAGGPSDKICGSTISQITQNMGIKPASMRVALHRLRKDNWITSHRAGRISYYRLTSFGLQESALASPKIYARECPVWNTWALLIAPPKMTLTSIQIENIAGSQDYVRLENGVVLARGDGISEPSKDVFLVKGTGLHVPDWLKSEMCDPILAQTYSELENMLDSLDKHTESNSEFSNLETATIRVLVVHYWRRIVLRHPRMPRIFFTDDWRGEQCRTKVHAILDRLDRPLLSDIETESRRPTPKAPPP